jgi:hypothetical protein
VTLSSSAPRQTAAHKHFLLFLRHQFNDPASTFPAGTYSQFHVCREQVLCQKENGAQIAAVEAASTQIHDLPKGMVRRPA